MVLSAKPKRSFHVVTWRPEKQVNHLPPPLTFSKVKLLFLSLPLCHTRARAHTHTVLSNSLLLGSELLELYTHTHFICPRFPFFPVSLLFLLSSLSTDLSLE